MWQFLDEVVGMPAVVQRQVPRCQEMTYTEQKVQILHQAVRFPAAAQRLTPMWRRTRTVETTRLQDREVVVDVPLDQDGHISRAFSRPRRSRVPRRQRICPPLWLARYLQQKKWECCDTKCAPSMFITAPLVEPQAFVLWRMVVIDDASDANVFGPTEIPMVQAGWTTGHSPQLQTKRKMLGASVGMR